MMRDTKRTPECKAKHRTTLVEHISNPDNPPLSRSKLSTEVLGFTTQSVIYQVFSPDELREIEMEALELRRKSYAAKLAKVDDGLLKRAADGDPAAAKLAYQRYEGWSEKQIKEFTIDGPFLAQMFQIFPPEIAEQVKAALVARQDELT